MVITKEWRAEKLAEKLPDLKGNQQLTWPHYCTVCEENHVKCWLRSYHKETY